MRANRTLGFTLVEMLIAIGILAMIAVLGWRGLDSMLRSRVALTDSMQQTRAMQRTFAQLQDDCAHLAVVEAIGEYARLRIEPNRFGLIRSVLAPDQATSLQAVVYCDAVNRHLAAICKVLNAFCRSRMPALQSATPLCRTGFWV
jgi:general secretion pathway protein J